MSTDFSNLYDTAGIRLPTDACVVIVCTEWNAEAVHKLEAGCVRILNKHKVHHKTITVPGAFEIPFIIKKYWEQHKDKKDKPHAFIALGCVVRGGTPHFEYVSQAVTSGISELNLSIPVPTVFGVLTVDDMHQVEERTGGKHGHKGEEAGATALKMIALIDTFN